MRKPIISIKLNPRNYAGLVNLANRCVGSLTGNLNFTTTSPPLLAVQSQITSVVNAIAVWGPKGNRGSHADLLDLRNKALMLSQTLKALSQYVQNTAQIAAASDYSLMAAIISTSGFDLAVVPTPVGVLNAVTGFRKMTSSSLNPNQVKFKWKKPLDASTANVYVYRVMRGMTTVFAAATQIATTSRVEFIDTNATGTVQTYTYWIVPVNNEGDGAASVAVTVSVLS